MERYREIMGHPSYQLRNHRPMQRCKRAAQFSSFAALTGFDEDINETARLTEPRENMCEDALAKLDNSFLKLKERWRERPIVTIRYFQPDKRKKGGSYVTYTGNFRFYDEEKRILHFTDGKQIPAMDIAGINM